MKFSKATIMDFNWKFRAIEVFKTQWNFEKSQNEISIIWNSKTDFQFAWDSFPT